MLIPCLLVMGCYSFVLSSRAEASFGGLVLRQWPPAVFGLARASRRRWLLREHVAVSSDNGGSWSGGNRLKQASCAREKSQKLAVLLGCSPDLGWRRIGRSRGLGSEVLVSEGEG
ncbi:hypothetical protein V8C44DRAFT_341901 [Trichoderma aethiopicum]